MMLLFLKWTGRDIEMEPSSLSQLGGGLFGANKTQQGGLGQGTLGGGLGGGLSMGTGLGGGLGGMWIFCDVFGGESGH